MSFFDFIGDAIPSVTGVVAKPISAIATAVSGGASKALAPVTNLASKALDYVSGVAKAGTQTTGQTLSGISKGVDGAVSNMLTPLSSGLGSGQRARRVVLVEICP